MVVPGVIGARSVKWLDSISIIAEECQVGNLKYKLGSSPREIAVRYPNSLHTANTQTLPNNKMKGNPWLFERAVSPQVSPHSPKISPPHTESQNPFHGPHKYDIPSAGPPVTFCLCNFFLTLLPFIHFHNRRPHNCLPL